MGLLVKFEWNYSKEIGVSKTKPKYIEKFRTENEHRVSLGQAQEVADKVDEKILRLDYSTYSKWKMEYQKTVSNFTRF